MDQPASCSIASFSVTTLPSSEFSYTLPGSSVAPHKNGWVELRDPLTPYSFDQALLLCEETEGRWIAWVPDYGEVILERHQFYLI